MTPKPNVKGARVDVYRLSAHPPEGEPYYLGYFLEVERWRESFVRLQRIGDKSTMIVMAADPENNNPLGRDFFRLFLQLPGEEPEGEFLVLQASPELCAAIGYTKPEKETAHA